MVERQRKTTANNPLSIFSDQGDKFYKRLYFIL